jgi:hypothetical protein
MNRAELTQLLRDRTFTTLRAAIALANDIPVEHGGNKEARTDAVQSMELAALALNDILPREEEQDDMGDVVDERAKRFRELLEPMNPDTYADRQSWCDAVQHRRRGIFTVMPFLNRDEVTQVSAFLAMYRRVPA